MVTRVPSIQNNYITQPAGAPPRGVDVVFVVGPYKAAPANAAAQVVHGPFRNVAAMEAVVGDDGIVHDAVGVIFSMADCDVYTCGTLVSAGDTIPTPAQTLAALAKVTEIPQSPTILYAPFQTSGGSAGGVRNSTDESPVITSVGANPGLVGWCNTLECIAFADGPEGATTVTAANFVTWCGNNLGQNIVGCFNEDSTPDAAGAGALAALVRQTALYGRGRGMNFAPVDGYTNLRRNLSYTPRGTAGTDVSNILNAGGTVLLRRNGRTIVLGDQFAGVTGVRRFVSVTRSLQHLEHVLETTGEQYLSAGITDARLQQIADVMEQAGRALVPQEIAALTVRPAGPDVNTPSARANGQAYFESQVTTLQPLTTIVLNTYLQA